MKMQLQDVTLDGLRKLYKNQATVEPEGAGFVLQAIGESAHDGSKPSLKLHMPTMAVPIDHGAAVNLLYGFSIPHISRDLMNLEFFEGFYLGLLFCKANLLEPEHIDLAICDPDECEYILVCKEFSNRTDSMPYGFLWKGNVALGRERYYSYTLVPPGYRYDYRSEKGKDAQNLMNLQSIRHDVITYANDYLDIKTAKRNYSLRDQRPHRIYLGRIIRKVYKDELSEQNCWAIDSSGRLIAPASVEDCKKFYIGAKVAENRTWDDLPLDTLVLAWSKPCIFGEHEFSIINLPEVLTDAQKERAAYLEAQIAQSYNAERISPFTNHSSPGVGKGWGIGKSTSTCHDEALEPSSEP